MAQEEAIYIICQTCSGAGIQKNQYAGGTTYEDRPCVQCLGTGYLLWGKTIKNE